MANNKSQHYVPQFFLKRFSLNGNSRRIAMYNIDRSLFIPCASISDQACKDYFYTKDVTFEGLLSEKESTLSEVIRRLLSSVPIGIKHFEQNIDVYNLVNFLRARTESYFDEMDASREFIAKQIANTAKYNGVHINLQNRKEHTRVLHIRSFVSAMLSTPIIHDLTLRLLVNKTKIPFLVSDNPVVCFNKYLFGMFGYNQEGLALKGVVIIIPLDPQHCLLYKDDNYIAIRSEGGVVNVTLERDVNEINALQYLNRPRNLFFNEMINKEYIESIITQNVRYIQRIERTFDVKDVECVDGTIINDCITTSNYKHNKEPKISFILCKSVCNLSRGYCYDELLRRPDQYEKIRKDTRDIMRYINSQSKKG